MSYIKMTAALALSVLLCSGAQAQEVKPTNTPEAPARFTPIERTMAPGAVGVSCSSRDKQVDCFCTGGCKRSQHDCNCTGFTGAVVAPTRE